MLFQAACIVVGFVTAGEDTVEQFSRSLLFVELYVRLQTLIRLEHATADHAFEPLHAEVHVLPVPLQVGQLSESLSTAFL